MDRFDDIWKNRFNEDDLPINDWNSPDDEVWKGVMAEVAPPKKKRRFLWFWFSLGIVLLLLISAYLIDGNNGRTSDKSTSEDRFGTLISGDSNQYKIAELDNNEVPKSEVEKNMDFSKKNNTSRSINISPSKKIENNLHSAIANTNTYLEKSIENQITKNIPNTKSLSNQNYEVSSEKLKSDFFKTKSATPSDGMSNWQKEKPLLFVPFLMTELEIPTWSHSVQILPEWQAENLIPPINSKIGFSVQAGAVFWKHRISDAYTSDLSPFDFNYENNWGWQTNFSVNVGLGKYVDAFASVQYEQIQTKSGHNSELKYRIDDEADLNNPLNGYALSLATPYGLSAASFNMLRNRAIAVNEVDLLVDFHSTHIIKNLSLPVGAMIYPFGKNNKLTPAATVGFGINYLASISNSIQSIDTNHDAIQYEDSGASTTFVKPDVEQWHFDYRLGVGLNYQLSKKSKIQLNYDWSRGLNPIFQQDNYKTFIDRHHIALGLTHTFSN